MIYKPHFLQNGQFSPRVSPPQGLLTNSRISQTSSYPRTGRLANSFTFSTMLHQRGSAPAYRSTTPLARSRLASSQLFPSSPSAHRFHVLTSRFIQTPTTQQQAPITVDNSMAIIPYSAPFCLPTQPNLAPDAHDAQAKAESSSGSSDDRPFISLTAHRLLEDSELDKLQENLSLSELEQMVDAYEQAEAALRERLPIVQFQRESFREHAKRVGFCQKNALALRELVNEVKLEQFERVEKQFGPAFDQLKQEVAAALKAKNILLWKEKKAQLAEVLEAMDWTKEGNPIMLKWQKK